MIKFSTWYFQRFNNLNDVIEVLRENRTIVNNIDWDDRDLFYRIEEAEGFNINEGNVININGEDIRYIYFSVLVEREKRIWNQTQPIEDRIHPYREDVLLYEDNNTIKLIVLATRKNSERIIKFMFPNEVWGEILEENHIDKDFLYWVFYRLRNFENTVELADNSNLYLTGLKSYMGKSRDEVNAVRGSGVRVAALLGTLAFIFNNEDLRALRPEFQYIGHTIVTEIHLDNSNRIYDKYYRGEFLGLDDSVRRIAILLFVCKSMISKLVECYEVNINLDLWSQKIKLNFLQSIGNSIRDTVDNELHRIENEMDRYRLNEDYEENDEIDEDDDEIENEEFEDELV